MNGVQSKRKEVKKLREHMTDKELFLSKAYQDSLRKFARVLGGNQAVGLVLAYTKEENSRIAHRRKDHIFKHGQHRDGAVPESKGKNGKP